MNIEKGNCKNCSYFQKYQDVVKGDDYGAMWYHSAYSAPDEACLFVGKCEKCATPISVKYLKEKHYCPFVKFESETRLLRIWAKVWNFNS